VLLASLFLGLYVLIDLLVSGPNVIALVSVSQAYATGSPQSQASSFAVASYIKSVIRLSLPVSSGLLSVGIRLIGTVQRRCTPDRAVAYLGIASGIVGLVYGFSAALPGLTGFVGLSALLELVWFAALGWKLLQLGRGPTAARAIPRGGTPGGEIRRPPNERGFPSGARATSPLDLLRGRPGRSIPNRKEELELDVPAVELDRRARGVVGELVHESMEVARNILDRQAPISEVDPADVESPENGTGLEVPVARGVRRKALGARVVLRGPVAGPKRPVDAPVQEVGQRREEDVERRLRPGARHVRGVPEDVDGVALHEERLRRGELGFRLLPHEVGG
jgi:hypothetical protein